MKEIINCPTRIFTIIFVFVFAFLANSTVKAQPGKMIYDQENLFTQSETVMLDSILLEYRQKTGNLVGIFSDSLYEETETFNEKLKALFSSEINENVRTMVLILSRKMGQIDLTGFNMPEVTDWQIMIPILDSGLNSIKEKKLVEGVVIICGKAMEFMDGLPVRKKE